MFSSRPKGSQNKVTIEVKDKLQSLIDEVVVDYVTKYIGKDVDYDIIFKS